MPIFKLSAPETVRLLLVLPVPSPEIWPFARPTLKTLPKQQFIRRTGLDIFSVNVSNMAADGHYHLVPPEFDL